MFGAFIRTLAFALALFPALAFAQSSPLPGFPPGVFQSRAAIDAGITSPPTFAFEARGSSSGSGAGPYTVSLATADTGLANRRLYAFAVFNHGSESALTSASSIGGVTCDVIPSLLGSGGGSQNAAICSAPVPTGNPSTVSLTFTGTPGSSPIVYLYSVNSALLISTTPVTSALSGSTSPTTDTVNVQANGSILLLGSGFGGSPTGINISASTCGITQSGTFGVSIGGLANGCAANSSSSASVAWTASTAMTVWLAALR